MYKVGSHRLLVTWCVHKYSSTIRKATFREMFSSDNIKQFLYINHCCKPHLYFFHLLNPSNPINSFTTVHVSRCQPGRSHQGQCKVLLQEHVLSSMYHVYQAQRQQDEACSKMTITVNKVWTTQTQWKSSYPLTQ